MALSRNGDNARERTDPGPGHGTHGQGRTGQRPRTQRRGGSDSPGQNYQYGRASHPEPLDFGSWRMADGLWRMAIGHYLNVRLNALILLLKDSPFLFIRLSRALKFKFFLGNKETCDSFKVKPRAISKK